MRAGNFCTTCGTANETTSLTCVACGAHLPAMSAAAPPDVTFSPGPTLDARALPRRSYPSAMGVACGLLIGIGAISVWIGLALLVLGGGMSDAGVAALDEAIVIGGAAIRSVGMLLLAPGAVYVALGVALLVRQRPWLSTATVAVAIGSFVLHAFALLTSLFQSIDAAQRVAYGVISILVLAAFAFIAFTAARQPTRAVASAEGRLQ